MDPRRSRLLLHPVRIRVSLVLTQSEMNVKQLSKVLDDVPQASLYRAVAELLDGGIIEVTREERRGGAIERYFRAIEEESVITRQDIGTLGPAEFVAGIEGLNRMLAADAARYIAAEESDWVGDFTRIGRFVAYFDDDERTEVKELVEGLIQRFERAAERRPGTKATLLNISAFPYVAGDLLDESHDVSDDEEPARV